MVRKVEDDTLRLAVALLLSSLLAGCLTPPQDVTARQRQLSQQEVDAVAMAVLQMLKDPNSAMFGRHVAFDTVDPNGTRMTVVCGLVNARNSFGGYVGMTPFLVHGFEGSYVGRSIGDYAGTVCRYQYGFAL